MSGQLPGVVTVHCFFGCDHIEVTTQGRSDAMECHFQTRHVIEYDRPGYPKVSR